jgi:hypothetical protein
MLQLYNPILAPMVLELAGQSRVKPTRILEDVIVSLHSWKHRVDFLIVTPKSTSGGYLITHGRIWLETIDSLIVYRTREMTISNGYSIKKNSIHPLA